MFVFFGNNQRAGKTQSHVSPKYVAVTDDCCGVPEIHYPLTFLKVLSKMYLHILLLLKFLECNTAFGMETGEITDGQISASSQYDDFNHAATKGRLRLKAGAESTGSWVVASGDTNVDQWLQIDLISPNPKVTGVATQGRDAADQWVTKYKQQYSNNGVDFFYYREQGQNVDKVSILY